jgi:hypothetical protein
VDWYQWEGVDIRKGCKRVNSVEILCKHVGKWKMTPVETTPGMGHRGVKNDRGDESN